MSDYKNSKKPKPETSQSFNERETAIIDARRIINHHQAEKLGFTYYGVGLG